MKNYNKSTILTTATLLGLFLLSQPTTAQADTKFYVGGNIGVSTLDPRVVGSGSVDDDSDIAFKIYAGYDVGTKKHLSLEAFYADMGAAHIKTPTTQGNVDYKLYGAGAVYNQPFNKKLSGFVKVGFAGVDNDANPNITVRQIEDNVIYSGLGLEYSFTEKFAARVEYEYFDKDIQLLSAGLRWSF